MPTLPFTVGFEMTGLVKGYKEELSSFLNKWRPTKNTFYKTAAIAKKLIDKHGLDTSVDFHCVEVRSRVCKSFVELDHEYLRIKKYFDLYKLTPHNPITVCGGDTYTSVE